MAQILLAVMTNPDARHPLVDDVLAEAERRMLTAGELAAELGIHPNTIVKWKNGTHQPRLFHRRKMIDWLKEPQE